MSFSEIDLQTRFLIVFSALIPFEMDMLPVMVVWAGFWLLSGEYKKFRWQRLGHWSILLLFYFAMHLVGFIYTDHLKEGWTDTRSKLSFLLLPVLLSTYQLTEQRRNAILISFFLSCLGISTVLLLRNFGLSLARWEAPLTYRHYCLLVHPSYFALYQCWALIIFYCLPVNLQGWDLKKPPYRFLIPGILVLSIMFASSKSGLIALLVSSVVLLTWFFFTNRKKLGRVFSYVLFGLVLAGIFTTVITSSPLNRFKMAGEALLHPRHIDNTARESTAMRLLIWRSGLEIIRENSLFGVGTGDINAELQKKYAAHGYRFPLLYKLNSHSQFLETQIMIGVFGLIPLICLIFGPFFHSLKRKKVLSLIFSTIILVNFSVESMLYQPAACVFYSFFLLLLLKNTVFRSNEVQKVENTQKPAGAENLTHLVKVKE